MGLIDLLETVMRTPMASWPSIKLISLLNLLRIVPVSVLVKKDCGALKSCQIITKYLVQLSYLKTVSKRTRCNERPVDGPIHTFIALQNFSSSLSVLN